VIVLDFGSRKGLRPRGCNNVFLEPMKKIMSSTSFSFFSFGLEQAGILHPSVLLHRHPKKQSNLDRYEICTLAGLGRYCGKRPSRQKILEESHSIGLFFRRAPSVASEKFKSDRSEIDDNGEGDSTARNLETEFIDVTWTGPSCSRH
jgi:hypothetical protein